MEDVTRRFGDLVAVDGISLEIGRGEIVAVLGANGAGKTTMLELLLGLVRPQCGVVRVLGEAADAAVARGAVGAMLQHSGLPARARVVELVELVRGFFRDPLPLDEVFSLCALEQVAERPVEALSVGQRQRVTLALAAAGRPVLLVLDEPTSAMDVAGRRAFWSRASDYVGQERSIVFSTHQLEEAAEAADRVVVLSHGRIVADASPVELRERAGMVGSVRFAADGVPLELLERLPAVQGMEVSKGRVTLRTVDPDRTLRALQERVEPVAGLEISRGGLEEAFLDISAGRQP